MLSRHQSKQSQQFHQSRSLHPRRMNVLLAVTGSVATIKMIELARLLLVNCEVKILMTESAKQFISQEYLKELGVQYYDDVHENENWKKRGDPVLHIELRKWADAMVIAPLSANTMAKIALGFCDTLVTLVCRCWDMTTRGTNGDNSGHPELEKRIMQGERLPEIERSKCSPVKLRNPLLICPAMNTMMWDHPVTEQHLSKLRGWGFTVVDPVSKVLMCGDLGKGAMADLQAIVSSLLKQLSILDSHPK